MLFSATKFVVISVTAATENKSHRKVFSRVHSYSVSSIRVPEMWQVLDSHLLSGRTGTQAQEWLLRNTLPG